MRNEIKSIIYAKGVPVFLLRLRQPILNILYAFDSVVKMWTCRHVLQESARKINVCARLRPIQLEQLGSSISW